MVIEGGIKEKKKKKKIKEVRATAENDGTVKYEHAAVQTDIKTEKVKICKEEQHLCDAGEKKQKKKKKKKLKEERVEAGELVAYNNDVSAQTDVNVTKGSQEKSVRPQKKKKEFKTESDDLRENVVTVNDSECLEKSKIKKAKKKRDKEIEASITEAGEIKKKKKKDVEVTEEMDEGHNVIMSPKKKKKKRKNIEEQELKTELDDGEVKKKRKKIEEIVNDERVDKQTEKKKNTEKNASFNTQHNDESVKGNKKIKNKKKTAPVEEEMNERTVNTENKTKKKKKKKKRLENQDEAQRECPANVNGTEDKNGDVIGHMMSSKHKKRKNIKPEVDDVTEIMEDELHDKKKSKQDKNKPMETSEVVLLSVKNGNQDEVSIDQARRLALQRDVDKESQPEPSLGQWGTAQFDSSERQAKFHRLLGGFKKSSQPITGIPGNVNMALGKDGQQTLQQGLLTEFERAQSRHLGLKNKGIGLGFTPPSNKKFAIDMNARNSIRFDD